MAEINKKYKSMLRSELAEKAGVSKKTFHRWLEREMIFIVPLGYVNKDKYLPPSVVKFLCEKYVICLE